MDRKLETSMLNEPQKRGLSATFRTLEEMMFETETMINGDGYNGTLVTIDNDVPKGAREEIRKKIQLVREKTGHLSKQFSLERKRIRSSSKILADLAYCWEILEGSKARRLSGYGKVTEGIEELLDPQIDVIIGLIIEMENFIKRGGKNE